MGFASGFRAGYDVVRDVEERRRKEELRQGLQRAGSLDQQTIFAKRQATPEEFARAQAETQALGQADAATFGFDSDFDPQGGMEMYAPAAPSPTAQVTTPSQYQIGGLTRETPFTQPEIQRARTEEMARVYEQQGMPEEAIRMRSLAQQQELSGLQLGQARRQEDYNTALQEINKQKFADPTERTAAILAATEAFDPATALKLRNDYTQAELNDITLKAKKFEQNYAQSRAKGLDAVIKWYDSVNDGFTLRREGNQIIQTDTTGNQRVFAQGTDDQIMMRMDAIAKPGGFLELAKAEADIKKSEADIKKSEAQAEQARETAAYLRRDRPRAGVGRASATLTDAEKIAYEKAIDQIAALGPDATPQEIAKIYRNVGLDPARFNVAGMPNWATTEPGGLAPSPGGLTRTIPAPNVTRPTSSIFSNIFGTKPPPSNINNLIRERQRDGTYGYRDLVTDELYSIDEYNQLLGVR